MYLLDKLAEIPDPGRRRREAARLLTVFDHPARWEVPDCGNIPSRWPSVEDLAADIDEDEGFYRTLEGYFEGRVPGIFKKCYGRFIRNKDALLRLAALGDDRWGEPLHAFPPYAGDFARAVFGPDGNRGCKLTKKLLGRGTFADVYAGTGPEGPIAIKLYRPLRTLPPRRAWYEIQCDDLLKNLQARREAFAPPFVQVHAVSLRGYAIMERFGRGFDKIRKKTTPDENCKARAILGYAEALNILHEQELCFGDNAWSALLLGKDEVRICDLDTVQPEGSCGPLSRLCHPIYASREHFCRLPVSRKSDLESFALMIDDLMIGKPWFPSRNPEREAPWKKLAMDNSRSYPAERARRLPQRLREVAAAFLNYPRDESPTIDDFVSAAKLDYSL